MNAQQPPGSSPGSAPGDRPPGTGECRDDVCITCSDTGVAVRVLELLGGGLAIVDTAAGAEEISVALVDAAPGDLVLVHAKEAIALLGKAP